MSAALDNDEAVRLLGPARMVLDRCAEQQPGCAEEAAKMAQQIVDLIGHRITDEPPHTVLRLERAEDLIDTLAAAVEVAASFFNARDEMNAVAHTPAAPRLSPITVLVNDAYQKWRLWKFFE